MAAVAPLLGIVRKIDSYSELGRTNQIVKDLKERTEELLEIYDEDEEGKEGYGEIDLEELTDKDKRTKLAQDLAKDKKEKDIVVTYQKDDSTIEELRQKISEAESKKANQSKNQAKETHEEALRAEKFASSEIVIISATDDEEKNGQSLNNSQAKLLNKFQKGNEETNELVEQPLQIQPPYGTPGSSKPN
ncbi:17286_t:CDS:2 [Funneliformis geosporum]|uniref:17286_t:CDS:1 n=1 Tax=Funneliformis geosporum TaxID=1117311 RepID=A0A9W4T6P7_9GLOM|nr:17286_t:CDS:2 [Funneliformis geosporum]